jgi:hypothetical protein
LEGTNVTTLNDIPALEANLAEIAARRTIVNERAAEAAAGLAKARDAHAAHVAAVVAGKASPDAAASPLPDAEFRVSIAQSAVQSIEAEYAGTSELLRQAKLAAEIAAREADLAAAAKHAERLDALLDQVNSTYTDWTKATAAVGHKYDTGALTGGVWKPYREASAASLILSRLHPEIIDAARNGRIDGGSGPIAGRVARS